MNSYLYLGKDQFKGSYNKYTKFDNVLKKYHKLLLANRYSKENWFFDQKQVAIYIQKKVTFQDIIEYCLNFDSDLDAAYDFLQDLFKISKLSNYEDARDNILEWCDNVNESILKLPELKKVALIKAG